MNKRKKQLQEQRGQVQGEMKTLIDAAAKENREMTAEESGKFDTLAKRSDEITGEISRVDRMIEAQAETRDAPLDDVDGKPDGPETREQDEPTDEEREQRHAEAFDSFLRGGREAVTAEQRTLLEGDPEVRALTVSGMGVVGTRNLYNRLVEPMKIYSGIREAGAEIMRTSNGNPVTVPTMNDTSNVGEIVGEGTATGDQDPTPGNVIVNAYKYSGKRIGVSIEALQDTDYDLEAAIVNKSAERIGRIFNTHATTGDNTDKPNGFVNGATGNRVEAAANAALAYDDLLDLQNGVDGSYWRDPSCGYMMSQTTLIDARKLKDDQNRPIWTPAFGAVGETLNGYRVTLNNDLANFGAAENSVVAAFGAFNRYLIRDVTRPYIVRDAATGAASGLVYFILFSRHDGELLDTSAIALLDLPA